MPRLLALAFPIVLAVSSGECVVSHVLPKTLATAVSPDGRYTAIVRRSFSIDPPDDHLFIATRGQSERNVMNLGADMDWCQTVVWSPDSRRVGFAINDEQFVIFEPETGALEARLVLTGDSCCGGAPHEARNIAFNADGKEAEASLSGESHRVVSVERPKHSEEKTLGHEVLRVPTSRLRLRVDAAGFVPSPSISVTATLKSGLTATVRAMRSTDGLYILPAIDDRGFDLLEISLPMGINKVARITLKDVTVSTDPVVVTLPKVSAN
jgi:hypothetical protein